MWFYRHLLQVDENATEGITNDNIIVNDNEFVIDPDFPPDLFTIEQLRNGAIILHIIGIFAKHQNISPISAGSCYFYRMDWNIE